MSEKALRSNLIRLASSYPNRSAERSQILKLVAGFDAQDIGKMEDGALEEGTPEQTYHGENYTEQEHSELRLKHERGELSDGKPDGRQASDSTLFSALIKLAHANRAARKPVLGMLREAGFLDEKNRPTKLAGCEKLPEGGMRENCEKKVEEGKDDK